jgi:hypothetical protein
MSENICYVYELVDPITLNPFYVGMGCGSRIDVYSDSRPKVNEFTRTKLEEIALSGNTLEIRYVSESLSEREAIALESELISKYGRIIKDPGGILTNIRSSDHPMHQRHELGLRYTTNQVSNEINHHIKKYCRERGLVSATVTEKLWTALLSGSIQLLQLNMSGSLHL